MSNNFYIAKVHVMIVFVDMTCHLVLPPPCLVMPIKSFFFGFCVSLASKNPYDLGSQIRFRILPKKRTLRSRVITISFQTGFYQVLKTSQCQTLSPLLKSIKDIKLFDLQVINNIDTWDTFWWPNPK